MPLRHHPREGQYESQNQPEKNLSHEIVLLRGLDGVSHMEWHQGIIKTGGRQNQLNRFMPGIRRKNAGEEAVKHGEHWRSRVSFSGAASRFNRGREGV